MIRDFERIKVMIRKSVHMSSSLPGAQLDRGRPLQRTKGAPDRSCIERVRSKMGASARGPKLPKRSVIERLTRKGPECLPEMMAMLSCFKEASFNEAKCVNQMRSLSQCVSQQVREILLRSSLLCRNFVTC